MIVVKAIISALAIVGLVYAGPAQYYGKETEEPAKEYDVKPKLPPILNETKSPDMYWRDYKIRSKIPSDAVLGGYTKNKCGVDKPLYLGKVHMQEATGFQPIQILEKSKSVKSSYSNTQLETNKNIQILCTKEPSAFTWIHINNTDDYDFEEDCIVAGYELDFHIFYGRTKHDDEVIVSKALPKRKKMYFPYQGREMSTYDFEILCLKNATTRKQTNNDDSSEEEIEEVPGPLPNDYDNNDEYGL